MVADGHIRHVHQVICKRKSLQISLSGLLKQVRKHHFLSSFRSSFLFYLKKSTLSIRPALYFILYCACGVANMESRLWSDISDVPTFDTLNATMEELE